ncbi:MAG: S8 family serine peptidase [candidate division WOR-3 bacterium]|nr:S8 family serine peptidase [candidate division WOR-3 bacterium]
MRLRILLVVAAAVGMTFAWPNLTRPIVSSQDGEEHMAGQIVVQLSQSQRGQVQQVKQDGVALFGIPALDELSRKWHVDDISRLMGNPRPNAIDMRYGCDLQYSIQFDANQDVAPVMADYRALPEVELVCPNGVMRFDEAPDDPSYASQWHYQNLGAAVAWGIAKGSTSVLNVPVDNGLDLEHPDIQANIWINSAEDINHNGVFDTLYSPDGDRDGIDQDGNGYADDVVGWDFKSGDPIPQAEGTDDHGTHCWGISNAVTNNGVGVAGTTWNSRSMVLRCGSGDAVTLSAATAGIYYAIAKGDWAISMSFGGNSQYQPLANACQAGWDNGLVLFGAAGNDGLRAQSYPACYSGVENVAASGSADKHSSFTNYGPWIDITAPGEGIYSTVPRIVGSYATMQGTSMSCPLAAGVASWVKSWNPALSNQEVLDIMHAACDTMPDSLYRIGELGAGRISMANVVLPRYWCDLKLQSWRFNDASGNNNGRPDPGETVSLIVTYYNTLDWQNATSVSATLACSDTNVQITKGTAGFPDIAAGSNGNCSADSFVITVPTSIPPQYLTFKVLAHATPEPAYPLTYFQVKCGEPRLLIVDDDEGSDFEKYYTAACDSNYVLYDKYTVQTSGSPSSDTLRHYPVVAWFTGNATTNTLTATDRTNLTSYLDNGGNLFIAGQNIAQELAADPFLGDYLHATFVDDSTGKIYMIGVPGDPITSSTGADTMTLGGAGGANNSKSADGIRPAEGGVGCATYKDYADTTVKSIVRFAGTYKVVFFSCAFEAIDHSVTRYLQKWTLMKRILSWFGEGIPPAIAQQMRDPEVKPYALKVSPNPFRNQALVEFIAPISGLMELKTFSTDGRLVASQTQTATMGQRLNFRLDGAKLANGTYLLQVVTSAGVYAQKTAVLK